MAGNRDERHRKHAIPFLLSSLKKHWIRSSSWLELQFEILFKRKANCHSIFSQSASTKLSSTMLAHSLISFGEAVS